MSKKIFFIIATVTVFGQNLFADDYYNYGEYPFNGYSVTGFIDKNGKLGEPGKEYIFHLNGNKGFIHRVDTNGDPQRHPDNPDSTGEVAERTFTFISSHIISNAYPARSSFHVDDSGIYYGPCRGAVKRWDFDWSNETTVLSSGFCGESFARNSRTGEFWAGSRTRGIYKWNGTRWEHQFTYPNLGGDHHDGMTIANDTIFVSDMTSDKIATYSLDEQGNVIDSSQPDHIYEYSASPVVENMGFGPNNHLWISSGKVIYEVGGGELQEELADCTQDLTLNGEWQMLTSACDVNATGFQDSVIMQKIGNELVVITDNNDTKTYYENLGYQISNTLQLKRGEGFWIRSENDSISHKLNGDEYSTVIELKKDTTEFIGLVDNNGTINLDDVFGNKPVKEIRYWDENTLQWYKWQPDHSNTDLVSIPEGHGFYVCVGDDFNISMPINDNGN